MKVSIITVVYNGEKSILSTMSSIYSQAYQNIEHIIIDGASSDNTLLNINKLLDPRSRLISEYDNGIYDAMNKGLALASGDIIGFLNAGDIYSNKNVLFDIVKYFQQQDIDSSYSDLIYIDGDNNSRTIRTWISGAYSLNKFYSGWMPPHPTFYVRKSVYEKHGGFNLNLGSAADYELMLRFLLKHRVTTAYIPNILIKMRTGGVSNSNIINRIKANLMDREAWRVNGLNPYPWTLLMKPLRKIGQWF